MIHIAGSVQRSFDFPAELPLAYAYYCDVDRLLNYLPHIFLVRTFSDHQFRMLYNTTELGVYHIRIYWDVETILDAGTVIRIQPRSGSPSVRAESGLYSSTTQGYFRSESVFHVGEPGCDTGIDYRLQLDARLPVPIAARFMPGLVLDRIANSIMHMRMREIADGFIERSIDAFPHWLAELHDSPLTPHLSARKPDSERLSLASD